MASKAVLEAKINDKNLSDAEIKRISKEARDQAIKEYKSMLTPKGITNEINNLKKQGEEYSKYKETLDSYEREINNYKTIIQNQKQEIENYQTIGFEKLISDYTSTLKERFQK
jgi:molecular chaperone GrpE (heat shock protein)